MPSQSPAPFEFEHTSPIPVDSYSAFLQREYGHGPARRNVMQVREVHIAKELSRASEHEYVVAHVEVPDGEVYYISFECLRGDAIDESSEKYTKPSLAETFDNTIPKQTGRPSSLSSPSPSSASLTSSGDSFSKPRVADDCVTPLQNSMKDSKDFDCGRLVFDRQKTLCLYELAILASSIHQYGFKYHLLGGNCYYYAHLLISILEKKYDIIFQPSQLKARKIGHWNGVFIHSHASPTIINDVRSIFDEKMLAFHELVNCGRLIIFISTNEIVLDGEGTK
jgi:hypothetical protein